jgi:hypothetical protein
MNTYRSLAAGGLAGRLPGRWVVLGLALGVAGWQGFACMDSEPPSALRAEVREERIERPFAVDVEVRRDPSRDTIRFLRGESLSADLEEEEEYQKHRSAGRFAEMAVLFVDAHRSAFRLERPEEELIPKGVSTDDLGMTHVKLQQVFRGIPVFAGELVVHFRSPSGVYLVNGSYIATPVDLETVPQLSREEALRIVSAELPAAVGDCDTCEAELVIVQLTGAEPHLAYRVRASVSLAEGWDFFVEAKTGAILHKLPTVYEKTD